MIQMLRDIFFRGVSRIQGTPQLWFTAFVAVVIVASFLYVANTYISIAKSADERLIDVRVGSLHDAFVPVYDTLKGDPDLMRSFMSDAIEADKTVTKYAFVTRDGRVGDWQIAVSPLGGEGEVLRGYTQLLMLAQTNPQFSFREEDVRGSERYFKVARVIVDTEGDIAGAVVTEQTLSAADKRLEESITESFFVLTGILVFLLLLFLRHARIIDYTELYRKLKEVDQLKDDFIGMASHELRTPLTAIRGYASILKEKQGESLENKEMLERIDTSAKELDQLIGDILDVSKIESGGMTFTLLSTDPHEVVKDVVSGLHQRAIAKGLTLEFLGGPDVRLSLDPVRFKQIMVNLVGNAIKYTEHGSIKIDTKIQAERLQIRVSDTGIGMSAEAQKKLFSKFYRASGEKVRAQTGTGLGLWITKQLVEKMRGYISVESIEGVGTHVSVSFPIVK